MINCRGFFPLSKCSHLLTCGCDGDVRIWKDIDDDDPVSHRAGDSVFAVSCKVCIAINYKGNLHLL